MIPKLLIAMTLILGLVHGENKLKLIGRLRDFSNINSGQPEAHPDFNAYDGYEGDLVKVDLGVDGKPVFNSARVPAAKTLTSEARFNQWYNDVKDVNKASDYTIELTDNGNGLYTYDNPAFFPLDNQGFGNDQNGRNFGFTYEIHTVFTYKQGQTFYFRGDDDLWVFINKKRVIDLGGVHGAMDQHVNLDDLGLTENEDYTLDIFFAERHVVESSFKITTSIQLKPSCAPPQIYNPIKNKCEDCILPSVFLALTGKCGPACEAPKIYNDKNFACEDCPAPYVYTPGAKGGCAQCPEGKLYLAGMTCGTCNGPKVYDPVTYTCDYCPEFYNYDGTCVPDCPEKLQDDKNRIPICNFPCPRKTQIYQTDKDKCRCSCPEPYTLTVLNGGYQLCNLIQNT